MTILQLKYVIAIASSASMREAAGKLFVSQPALSATIQELERELGIQIFNRNNKGITLTSAGAEFVNYAKLAVSQYALVEERYITRGAPRRHFAVSLQHYVFAVRAFISTVRHYGDASYTYAVNETKTLEVLSDVRTHRSEVGVISYARSNKFLLQKLLREQQLAFTPLLECETYVYLYKNHPLAGRETIALADLRDYPCVSFDQSSESEFYLPEEALASREFDRLIRSNDRATSAELMAELDGYSIGTGVMTDSVVLRDDFVTIRLAEQEPLTIGYIVGKNHVMSEQAEFYIGELRRYKSLGSC